VIVSGLDLVGALVLFGIGSYHLRRGAARVQRHGGGRWRSDGGALLSALLGGAVFAMGLWLLLYSIGFALLSERILSR
jgi:hypothetical protein